MNENTTPPTDPIALTELFQQYRRQKLRGSPHSTINWYNVTLRKLERYLGHVPTVDDLSNDEVSGFAWDTVEKGSSRATGQKHGAILCALWRFACKRGLRSDWPDVDLPNRPDRIPIAWLPDQLATLFKACQAQRGEIGGVPANLWWHGLHAVIWDTGERVSAVLSIRREWVDLQSGWLIVRAESRKGQTRDKTWKLHADTAALMRELLACLPADCDSIFPFPYDAGYIFYLYGKLLKRAGLPHDRKHKFHCLRKSVGSYFEAAGGNATELLDHSSRSVTKAYLDPRIVKQVQACDVLFRVAPEQPDGEPAPDRPPVQAEFRDDPESSRHRQFRIAGGGWRRESTSVCNLLALFVESPDVVRHADIERALGRQLTGDARDRLVKKLRNALHEALPTMPADHNPLPVTVLPGGARRRNRTTWTIDLPSSDEGETGDDETA